MHAAIGVYLLMVICASLSDKLKGFVEGVTYEFTHNNVISTHVLLETAKSVGGVDLFLQASSDEVYGKLAEPYTGV